MLLENDVNVSCNDLVPIVREVGHIDAFDLGHFLSFGPVHFAYAFRAVVRLFLLFFTLSLSLGLLNLFPARPSV